MSSIDKISEILPCFEETFQDLFSKINTEENSYDAKMMRVLTVLKNEFSDEQLSLIQKEEWQFIAHALFVKVGQERAFDIEQEKTESFFRNAVLNKIEKAELGNPLLN